ncbi:MAG: tetratricopeptide repeat protein [Candidatus Eremiobacteraeota bacterium]|nr:tetratricopeptide repeat protein [Candidatus Eremiobacteraeota bacterium]
MRHSRFIQSKSILILSLLFFVLLTTSSFPEEWTHFADIVDIVKESGNFDYHMTHFDKKIETDKLLSKYRESNPDQKLVEKGGENIVEIHKPTKEVISLLETAEKLMSQKYYDRAMEKLDRAQTRDPDYSRIDVLKGMIYFNRGRYRAALKQFDIAIKKNPIDFMAYKRRGDCYRKREKPEKALDNYILSIIYNRNYSDAWNALEDLGKEMRFSTYRLQFVPLYSFQKLDNGKVRIYFDDTERTRWMPYSFTKAVWRYDSQFFHEKTGLTEYRLLPREEIECIRNMTWAYNTFRLHGKSGKDPILERLERIQYRFFLREFVLFEILSQRNPEILLNMGPRFREDLIDYIKEFVLLRGK